MRSRDRIKRLYEEKRQDFSVWLLGDEVDTRNNNDSEVLYFCYWRNDRTVDRCKDIERGSWFGKINDLSSTHTSVAMRQCEWFTPSITAQKEIVQYVNVHEFYDRICRETS